MRLVFRSTLDNLHHRALDAENDSERWRQMYGRMRSEKDRYVDRARSMKYRVEELEARIDWAKKVQEGAKSAQEAMEKSEARATQLEAQNAALRGALLALGGAVIEVSQ